MDKWAFLREEEDNSVNFLQGDMTFIIAIAFLIMFLVVLPFIYDPSKEDPDKNSFESFVEWDGESRVDIDTWVWCTNPATGLWEIVSYQNRKGRFFTLNQDDRGFRAIFPDDDINKEHVISLGNKLPAALCGVNIHVFGTNVGTLPVDVTVSVILFKGHDNEKQVVLVDKKIFTMDRVGEEITVTSFEIDSAGNLVLESNKTTVQMRCASSFARNCSLN